MVPLLFAALLACAGDTDADADGFPSGVDCDDADPAVHPGAEETCNEVDDDCDDLVDEDPTDGALYYADADGDGYAGDAYTIRDCGFPAGYQPFADDCDDGDALVSPQAVEVCDGIDNDCDDFVDEGIEDPPTWYADTDGDGWGDAGAPLATCDPPEGYVDNALDCDDGDPQARPDGTFHLDADGDGWGTDAVVTGCRPATGAVDVGGDCDDTDPGVYPGAPETCDGVDQDCDTEVDEDPVDGATWYADEDGDGWGDPALVATACEAPAEHVAAEGDCDPADGDSYPGAPERCGDGVDQDCNGVADNTCAASGAAHDLASVRFSGPALSGDSVGQRVAAVDLDGDGHLELAVADPGADDGRGGAWLLAGPLSSAVDLDDATASLAGEDEEDGVGARVLALPAVGGQGALAVAAPGWDDPVEFHGDVGALAIFLGPQEGALALEEADGFYKGHRGAHAVGAAGLALADLDGDGELDLALGAPSDTDARGAVFLAWGPLTAAASTADLDRLDGEGPGLGLGDAVAAGRDHDGDGVGDLLVGASAWRGAAYLWYGPVTAGAASDEADVALTGDELGAAFGAFVGQGDLDGDGYADLVIGAPDATGSVGEVGAGAVRVWAAGPAGIDDAPFLAVEGSAADTGLGRSPGALLVADLDLDGVDDLAWGLPYDDSVGANAGAIGLLYGPVRGSMEHTRADRILTGPGTTAYLGTDLALAEVDGLPEALVAGSTYGLSLGGEALLLPLDALR